VNLNIKQTLGRTLVAIPIVMGIISLLCIDHDSLEYPTGRNEAGYYQCAPFYSAIWPGLTYKIEDGKYFIKKRSPLSYRPYQEVASDEYHLAVRRDYHDVFRTYYFIAFFIALGIGCPLAFPSERFGEELSAGCGDEKHADDRNWPSICFNVFLSIWVVYIFVGF